MGGSLAPVRVAGFTWNGWQPSAVYADDLVFSNELRFLDEIIGAGEVSVRSTSVLAQQELIASGVGIGILPSFSADLDPRLIPILPDKVEFRRTFWMVMPEELKNVARMRVVWDHLREMADNSQGLLQGTGRGLKWTPKFGQVPKLL